MFKKSVESQAGQGMLEYLLVLIFTVGLILALDKGMGKPLREYLQTNILDVIGCMMRSGVYSNEKWDQCSSVGANFSFSSSSGGSGSSGSGGNNNNDPNNSSDDDAKSSDDEDGDGDSDDGDTSDNNSSGDSDSSGGRGGRGGRRLSAGNQTELGGGDEKRVNLDSEGGGAAAIAIKNNEPPASSSSRQNLNESGEQIGGSFLIMDDKNKSERDIAIEENSRTTKKVDVESDDPKVGAFSVSENKSQVATASNDNNSEFSFFGLIKWALIIGCLIIFIIFIGMQLNTIRKGWTK